MKFLLLILPLLLQAFSFKVANYNVENLFDMNYSGQEYKEYIPNSSYGWNRYMYQKKLSNISKVLYDLKADIVGLEEIESKVALLDLRKALKRRGLFYRYYAIANKKKSTVKVAILSKYKITKIKEIKVSYKNKYRNILEVHLLVDGKKLIIFVNHWKSKSGPESERIRYAKALKKRINELSKDTDYIILGDFNSNYNEDITFLNDKRLNNTNGKTGINNILQTTIDLKPVKIKDVMKDCHLLYNLWLELPYQERFSYIYQGEKDTIDNMLLPCSMFDKRGIDYIRQSFSVFKPPYLFGNGSINRWKRRYGYGKFTGKGYSDHLPIFAYFTTDNNRENFAPKILKRKSYDTSSIKNLYHLKYLSHPVLLKNVVVVEKDRNGATIKTLGDRAVYIFRYNQLFKIGYLYDIVVKDIKYYKNNLEISSLINETRIKKIFDLKPYYIYYTKEINLSDKKYQNEIIYKISGIYKNGYLWYDKNKKIRVYNKIKKMYIQNGTFLSLRLVRIVTYKYQNEIIIYYKKQIIKQKRLSNQS